MLTFRDIIVMLLASRLPFRATYGIFVIPDTNRSVFFLIGVLHGRRADYHTLAWWEPPAWISSRLIDFIQPGALHE